MQARPVSPSQVFEDRSNRPVVSAGPIVASDIRPTDFTLLHTKPLLTKPLLVDLSLTQSGCVLHSIASGACSPAPTLTCNCVHYGFCAPVSCPVEGQQLSRSSRLDPSVTIGRNSDPGADLPGRLSHSTAFNLIANDEESHDLQHLINNFITGEKMKQQNLTNKMSTNTLQSVKLRPIGNRLSQSMGNLNALPVQQPTYNPSDLYIRGRSSHSHKIMNNSPMTGTPNRQNSTGNREAQPLIVNSNSKIRISQSSPKSQQQLDGSLSPSTQTSTRQTNGSAPSNDNKISPVVAPERVASKLIFGLSDKSNKNKYLQLANSRQLGPVSTGRTGGSTSQQGMPSLVALDPSNQLSNSEIVGRVPDERFANQLMQLTDDEKVQYIIASQHTSLQKSDKQPQADTLPVTVDNPSADPLIFEKQQEVKAKLRETSKQNLLQPKVNQSPQTNLSKYRSLSCDSLYGSKQLIDFKTYQGPQMIDYSSPFDYAKTRFINSFILSGLKVPDNKRLTPSQDVVLQTKKNLLERTAVPSKVSEGSEPKSVVKRSPVDVNVMKIPVRNPVKPYLSRGSVAERVLLFEKCPEIQAHRRSLAQTSRRSKSPVLYRHWKNPSKDSADTSIAKDGTSEGKSIRTLSRRFSKQSSVSSREVPRFHFPCGRPYTSLDVEKSLCKIRAEFEKLPGKCVIAKSDMSRITKACGVPLAWKEPMRQAVISGRHSSSKLSEPVDDTIESKITCDEFLEFWRRIMTSCFDDASRFVAILSKGRRTYLLPEDFVSMIQDIVDYHPGLTFLKEAMEFHSRYVHTVIARIYYCVNRSWSGRLTIPELRKSNFLAIVALLDEEEDINQITEYFSYEHFYVIYCKFWELDKDHDLIIDKNDLSRHNDSAISVKMIDRIFSGAVTRGPVLKYGKMTYSEFVWFLISEEDKTHPRAIEYWFRCMDLDGDGFLSIYELEWFYTEQSRRLEAMGIEPLPFKDTLCQMLDMIRPEAGDKISLSDLKRSKMTPVFFDTFFNLEKYLDHEQKDPFASNKNEDDISDWDRFAAEEYEILVAEENQAPNQTKAADGASAKSAPDPAVEAK